GRGFSFIIPVAVLVRWFPDHRGLVTGIAAGGYGGGTLVTAPVATQLIAAVGVLWTFALLGLASAIMVAGSAVWLKAPPAGYSRPSRPAERNQRVEPVARTFTLGEACRTWQCSGLCLLFFVYVSAGHAFISQAAPIAQELVRADAFVAAGLVGGAAIANVAGGLLCPWLSDAIGRRVTLTLLFLLQSLTLTALTLTTSLEVFALEAALVLFCFGGGFSTMAPLVADYFGAQQVGSLFGLVLIASGLASLAGPLLLAFLRESTGAYTAPLTAYAVLTLLGSLIPLALRPPNWTPERGLARREPQPGHQAL
ncbi:MAG: MFS transporter, partial [Chloroflexi bacterium]|nr:MFS transporter [Chloroflexota bacterium]